MKVIYSGVQYSYYDPRKGTSFEHETFYKGLAALPGVTVSYAPFERIVEVGKKQFNHEVLEKVRGERPDLFFAFMLSDEFDRDVLKEIEKHTTTLAWFADDHWRFHNYSRRWAPYFSWSVTTYSEAVEWYRACGVKNVIRSQWGANPALYRPTRLSAGDVAPDVYFVGSWSRPRARVIGALRRTGISVVVNGNGWPERRAPLNRVLGRISHAKINLGLNPAPGYINLNSLGRLFLKRSRQRIVPDAHFSQNFAAWLRRGIPQIKARHFEIPACGGFLLTTMADDLDRYYVPDKEVVMYTNTNDLIEKIRYYLAHDAEREHVANAGYERTIKDHTYEKRFRAVFAKMGLG